MRVSTLPLWLLCVLAVYVLLAVQVINSSPDAGASAARLMYYLAIVSARKRIDIVNPYISNRAILARLLEAARRGMPIRLIAPGKPTPPYPAAAFRHHYERLMDAGVEILLHPEMAHAKVLRIDDRVLIGGCNLDDLSLFRNDELDLLFDLVAGELLGVVVMDVLTSST